MSTAEVSGVASPAASATGSTSGGGGDPVIVSRKTIGTIRCFLCGGVQVYPGPRYESHLINEHGVLDVEYMIELSLYKERHGKNPPISEEPEMTNENGVKDDKPERHQQLLCARCGTEQGVRYGNGMDVFVDDDVDDDEDEEMGAAAEEESDEGEMLMMKTTNAFHLSEEKRKPVGKEWGPNSFSSTFTCHFCDESFRKDYKLKLHLMLNHKNEDPDEMIKAKEVLTKSKLDGCIHRCAICGSKYNSVANFTRHIKDVHQITRAEYREEYGSSEVVSRMFKCELCDKEVKHTRNIIGAHMKMVHLISWKEYQEILVKLRQGLTVGDLPAPELFDCIICGVSVKYRREHLNKKHQITEEVYDELIAKKNRGEDINEVLPEREVYRCLICKRECMDLKKHLDRSHQITEEIYEEMTGGKIDEAKWAVRQITKNVQPPRRDSSAQPPTPRNPHQPKTENGGKLSPVFNGSSCHTASMSSTDLRCYFGCDEIFKKDYQLHLHLKLRHRDEDPDELKLAYEAADEEIALTKRSGSTFQCALCPKTFTDNGAFYGHIQSKHNIQWKEYKERYGRCEVESAPFECKICGRVVKYDRNTVHTHLKNVHGITWAIYLDRIRKMRRGEMPDDLPNIETHECRVCNVNVKYIREHLKNVHKITENEYEELFNNDEERKAAAAAPLDYLAPDVNLAKPPKSDIQDKTNKKCSSCSITFDSRRSFIEHCTTVHNMKFRTKSGATISAPTLQQQKTAAATKRKSAADAQNNPFPALKKPKLNETFGGFDNNSAVSAGGGEEENEELSSSVGGGGKNGQTARKTLYTPAGVSKWNQCMYECCFCKRTTMSRSSMTSHIHNTHGIQIKDYKESNYPDIEVETNWFQCRLCPARTKFVKDCIAPHLKMSHSMDIDTYEREVMQPEDWPYEVVSHPTLSSTNVRDNALRVQGNSSTKYSSQTAAAQSTPTLSEKRRSAVAAVGALQGGQQTNNNNAVAASAAAAAANQQAAKAAALLDGDKWNRCKYQCCLCDLITLDHRQIRIHIATQHQMPYNDYIRQYGGTEIVSKRFRCDLCKSEMKFCRQNVYAHMKDVHRMTLDEYDAKVGMGSNGEFDGDEEDGGGGGNVSHDDGDDDDDNNDETEIVLQGEAQTSYSMNPPQTSTPVVRNAAAVGLLDDGRRPSRWNKCRFKCLLCNKLSSEKRHVREHIVKAHGLTLQEYESRHGSCEIHTEYFFCAICHAEVKHNLKNISLHLQNSHSMSSGQYEEQYGRLAEQDVDRVDQQQVVEDDFGFGSHFMLDDDGQERYLDASMTVEQPEFNASSASTQKKPTAAAAAASGGNLTNPPKSDVQNPKNKFCSSCNRDFNRRQAFVEHCRNVHRMNIRFATKSVATINDDHAKPPPSVQAAAAATAVASAAAAAASAYKCDYCPKSFSSRSNKNRHMLLSCEVAGPNARNAAAAAPRQGDASSSTNPPKRSNSSSDYIYDPQISRSHRNEPLELKCSQEGCREIFARSALMKRHLIEIHNVVMDGSSPDRRQQPPPPPVKSEPVEDEDPADGKKVPPLRVKIAAAAAAKEEESLLLEDSDSVEVPVEFDAPVAADCDVDDDNDEEEEEEERQPQVPVEATLEVKEKEENSNVINEEV